MRAPLYLLNTARLLGPIGRGGSESLTMYGRDVISALKPLLFRTFAPSRDRRSCSLPAFRPLGDRLRGSRIPNQVPPDPSEVFRCGLFRLAPMSRALFCCILNIVATPGNKRQAHNGRSVCRPSTLLSVCAGARAGDSFLYASGVNALALRRTYLKCL